MAQFYSLEEAARLLGMSPDELKWKAQHREIRAFLDGGSWRFRVVDIDELARRRGMGSDAELPLSDLDVPTSSGEAAVEDLDLSEFQIGVAKPDLGAETTDLSTVKAARESPAEETGSDHELLFDDLSVPPSPVTGSSSVIIGMKPSGKLPSDSDVRLVPDEVKGSSDSDVRLASPDPDLKVESDSDITLIKDDTFEQNVLTPASGSGDTAIRKSPASGSSAEVPAAEPESDFEFASASDLEDVLQPESGSDFELSALDGSDEFEATPLQPSDSDVTAADPNLSGINLSRPSDSGINLQGTMGYDLDQQQSIELAPLSSDELKAAKAEPIGAPKPKAAPAKPSPALSQTPPPALGKGEKDIFEDTDFEVDVPLSEEDSDDKTVQLEAVSDFELDESESGSEVFAIDEEDVDQNAATAMAAAPLVEEEEEDDGFEEAVSSEIAAPAWTAESTSRESAPAMVLARETEPEWGAVWVGLLGFTLFGIFLGLLVAADAMRNLYEYRDTPIASALVSALAGLFG